MSASDVSPFHLFPACFTLLSDTCRWRFGLVCVCVVFVFFWFVVFPCFSFASGRVVFRFLQLYSYR